MKEMISIIVPVYNVELYLPQCLDSIVNQSYRNLEVIIIDDGSSDNSGRICDEYAARDSRIIVKHQKNGGAANAKNAALQIASGEYLTFADADDYIEPDAYKYMVSVMNAYNADIVQGTFRNIFTNREEDFASFTEEAVFDTVEYLKGYTKDWTCSLLWDKLYKRRIFNNILFEEGHIVDDEFFTYQGVMNAEKIVRVPEVVYNYRKRKSSVTAKASYRTRTVIDKLDYLEKRRKNVISRFPELRQDFEAQYLDMLLWVAKDPYMTGEGICLIKKMLNNYFGEKNHCRIKLPLLLKIKELQYLPVEVLLKQRNQIIPEEQMLSGYFD